MIKPSEFKDWQEYYWTYQNILAKKYLIPMLAEQGITTEGRKILEIGCGSGGVIEAFSENSARAVGVEINPFDYSSLGSKRVEYITADIYDPAQRASYRDVYDLILFRDVIEHLPDKKATFELCDDVLAKDGKIFISFPPYNSPFGGHQQVFSKSFLGKLPYVQLLPDSWYLQFVKTVEKGNEPAIRLAHEMVSSKTSISVLYRDIRNSAFKISNVHYYWIRPSYEIRYGRTPRRIEWMKYLPGLRELFVLGVYMTLERKKK